MSAAHYCAFGKSLCRGAAGRHDEDTPLVLREFPPLARQAALEYAQRNGVRLSPGRGAGVLAVSEKLRCGWVRFFWSRYTCCDCSASHH